MKYRKVLVGLVVTAVFIAGGLIWWGAPTSLIDIAPAEVSRIEIFDGGTGKTTSVTGVADIAHIIDNLNAVSLKKQKLSLGYMGYGFKTTIYKTDGSVYKQFIINSNDTIRKDPFFYRDSAASIDYSYIQGLVAQ
jgi:hypothetical protein